MVLGIALAGADGAAGGPGGGPAWKAGVARTVITPEESMWLAGYGHRTRPSEGKIHDLWVKVLALEDSGGGRAVLVVADHLGFPRSLSERIAAEAERRFGLDRARLLLSATHTHSGPVLEGCLLDCYPLDDVQLARIAAYSRRLEGLVVDAIGRALDALAPATLAAGEGKAAFAVNRRTNREAEVPKLIESGGLKGPVDHAVPVLAVRDAGGRLLAAVYGYACHNTVLDTYPWCGDYAGFAAIEVEKVHPGTTAIFWAGCGSDQNPLPRRSVALAEKYGKMLAAAIEETLGRPLRPIAPRLRAARETTVLLYEKTASLADLEAAAASGDPLRVRWGKRLLARLDRGEVFPAEVPFPVGAWSLGDDILWIALGGEVVVDYSLRLRGEYGPATWVMAYANDVMGYIPSRRVQDEGGYESGALVVYGHPAERWAPGVEERVAAAVHRAAARVRGVSVRKDLYLKHPRPGAAALAAIVATGPGDERMEVQGVEARDDVPSERRVRFSSDGGRTWSDFSGLPDVIRKYGDVESWEGPGPVAYDPASGALVGAWLRQLQVGGIWNCFTSIRISRDGGRTWTEPRQLRYEEGEEFDPRDPLRPGFLRKNQSYFGSAIVGLADGTLLFPMAHANAAGDPGNDGRPWKMGSLCFRGRWDPAAGGHRWEAGRRVEISPDVSSRGLMEPDAAELRDGRVLVIWRGSDTPRTPGRKWFALSTDGGRTLDEPRELRWDDGSSFLSPSSYHRLLRHGRTGRLLWIGNISRETPRGNWPRYPLVIAEVDEGAPALKRGTLAMIDDRGPDGSDQVQFSNFSLLEDRATGELEMSMTLYGIDAKDVFSADCWRYRIGLAGAP
jgi:hypothetical protein